MSGQDIEIAVAHRAPLFWRGPDGRVERGSYAVRKVETVLRHVPPGEFAPFPDTAPEALEPYRIHDGRAWIRIPAARSGALWDDLPGPRPADLRRAVSALRGNVEWVNLAAFGRGPLSARPPLGLASTAGLDGLEPDEGSIHLAAAHVAGRFARGVVHDGSQVWVETPLPGLRVLELDRVGSGRPGLLLPPAAGPNTGPWTRADRAGPYLGLAAGHGRLRGAPDLARLAGAVAYHADRAGLAIDDADLGDASLDLPALAWREAGAVLPRVPPELAGAIEAHRSALAPRALLGAMGILPEADRLPAVEEALELLAACGRLVPRPRRDRRLDWVVEHARRIVRPRLLVREGLPVEDAEAIHGLAP